MTSRTEAGDAPPELLAHGFLARPAREVAPELLGCVLEHETAEGLVAVELTEVEAYEGLIDPASHSYRGRTPRNAVMWGPPGFGYVYFTYGMHYCVNVVCQPAGTPAAVLIRAGRVIAGEQLARQRRAVRPHPPSVLSQPPAPPTAAAPAAPATPATPATASVATPDARPSAAAPAAPATSAASAPAAPASSATPAASAPAASAAPEARARPLATRDLARGPGRLCQALGITLAQNGLDCCDPASPLRLRPPLVPPPVPPAGRGPQPRADPSPRISAGPRVGVTAAADVAWRFWLTDDPTVSDYRLHKPRPR